MTIEAAERLLARYGADRVSMRQIAAEAGASNHFAVQYHFGDMAGLIRAIFEHRLPSLEARRSKLLTAAAKEGRLNDPRSLVEVILRPIAEEKDREGRLSYAAFLESLRHFEGIPTSRMKFDDLTPVTRHAQELLAAAVPWLPQVWFFRRLVGASTIFLRDVVEMDRRGSPESPIAVSDAAFLQDALDVATAVFMAPISPQLRLELEGPEQGDNAARLEHS